MPCDPPVTLSTLARCFTAFPFFCRWDVRGADLGVGGGLRLVRKLLSLTELPRLLILICFAADFHPHQMGRDMEYVYEATPQFSRNTVMATFPPRSSTDAFSFSCTLGAFGYQPHRLIPPPRSLSWQNDAARLMRDSCLSWGPSLGLSPSPTGCFHTRTNFKSLRGIGSSSARLF